MFKVGDKFIVEVTSINRIGEDTRFRKPVYAFKDLDVVRFSENDLKMLEKYNETEAYTKGYAKAMEDIQKAIRTFLAMNCENREKYFDGEYAMTAIFGTYDFREIIEKLEAYEKEQSEIRVGDEVEVIDFGCEAVVTCTNKHLKSVFVLYTDGSTDEFTDRTKLKKTGRHFDEVEKLIEILKGGDDSE